MPRWARPAAALTEYTTAVELRPDFLEAMVKMGTTQLRGGSYLEAARAFSKALEINDRILSAYIGLGVAQQAVGNTEDALETFETAVADRT